MSTPSACRGRFGGASLRPSRSRVVGALLVAGLLAGRSPTTAVPPQASCAAGPGVEVLAVEPGSRAAAAGLVPGDALVGWSGEEGRPSLAVEGIAAWVWLERSMGPRQVVELEVSAGDGRRGRVSLEPGRWGVEAAPRLAPDGGEGSALHATIRWLRGGPGNEETLAAAGRPLASCAAAAADEGVRWWARFAAAERLAAAGRDDEAEIAWAAAAESEDVGLSLLALERLARSRLARQDLDGAEAAALRFAPAAAGAAAELPLEPARADLLAGRIALLREDLALAGERFAAAARDLAAVAPASVERADALYQLAIVARREGRLAAAREHLDAARALLTEADPEGPLAAFVHNGLGLVAWAQGDLVTAEEHLQAALGGMVRAAVPDRTRAVALSNLALIARDRGELRAAERYLRHALAIEEPLAGPEGSWSLAMTLNTAGMVAADRGDLEAAHDAYSRALTIVERVAPGGPAAARILENLGLLELGRGRLDLAEPALRRSLELKQARTPEGLDVAMALSNLATLHLERGELEVAERLQLRSLALKETVAPESLVVSNTLMALAGIARRRGDLEAARERLERALALRLHLRSGGGDERDREDVARETETGGGSLFVAESLRELGSLARQQEDLETAERRLTEAVAIGERVAPLSIQHARSLHELGLLQRQVGQAAEAAATLLRGIDALEAQSGRLGVGHEATGEYRARHLALYRDAIAALLALGRADDAFHVLERSRARMLLAMLAERDLTFASAVPEELERQRRQLGVELDAVQEELRRSDPARPDEQRALELRMASLVAERQALDEQVRVVAPQLADLRTPVPLDAAAVRRGLDAGTVLVAYSVGELETDLFLLTQDALEVARLPVGEEALAAAIARFRRGIDRGRWDESAAAAQGDLAAELYGLLLGPVDAALAGSRRLVVLPDGPLQFLPFSALLRRDAAGERFLAQWLPLSVTHSATVGAQLRAWRERRRPAEPLDLVAFGDPQLAGEEAHAERAAAYPLPPLPGSRAEVGALLRLFEGRAEGYLGAEATEARAKAAGSSRYLHFATHALLNERFPLSSALLLRPTPGGDDNGLLQVWEIFDEVRLAADLVVLSACESALGAAVRGEGLIGLTRAFQYAGAASVAASLWRVGDASTALLMERFYTHLRAGFAKDDALAAAQRDLLIRPATAHPYHWAGFVLYGDWR